MRAKEFIAEEVTEQELSHLRHYLIDAFSSLGLDFKFGYHFYQRVNDARNKQTITIGQLQRLFVKSLKKFGKKIGDLPPGHEVVLRDLATHINVPILRTVGHSDQADQVVAKTVMRKKDFGTSNQVFAIEQQLHELADHSYEIMLRDVKQRGEIRYYFETEAGEEYVVSVGPVGGATGAVQVAFGVRQGDSWTEKATGQAGAGAIKIFSTVIHCLKDALATLGDVEEIYFAANELEPTRVSLYKRFAQSANRFLPGWTNLPTGHLGAVGDDGETGSIFTLVRAGQSDDPYHGLR